MNIIRLMIVVLCAAGALSAEVKLPAVFGDNMVLQRNGTIPIWGRADANEQVTIELRRASSADASRSASRDDERPEVIARATAAADVRGAWRAELPRLGEGGPYVLSVSGKNTVRFTNVMIGDVWLCSGQSNMEFALKKTAAAEEELRASGLPMIRLFTVKHAIASEPQSDCSGSWNETSPETAENFSAVAFFFARELQPKLGCAIGLIHSAWGGTPAEAWMPHAALASDPEFRSILETWEGYYRAYPEAHRKFEAEKDSLLRRYEADAARARAERTPLPRKPADARGPGHRDSPSGAYNGMIAPLAPFAMRGVLWYQGEANAVRAVQYRRLFPAMIAEWRALWHRNDLPFLFVQLPNLIRTKEKDKQGWILLREAQLHTLSSVPHTGMAVTIDLGDSLDIHPTNKRDVGHRLALIARAMVYGEKGIEYSGPLYNNAKREGARMRVAFTHAHTGLRSLNGAPLREFEIAGSDKKFLTAHARIEGATVVVWNDEVKNPAYVRYGWKDNPRCTLANASGLTASPFRTDADPASDKAMLEEE